MLSLKPDKLVVKTKNENKNEWTQHLSTEFGTSTNIRQADISFFHSPHPHDSENQTKHKWYLKC